MKKVLLLSLSLSCMMAWAATPVKRTAIGQNADVQVSIKNLPTDQPMIGADKVEALMTMPTVTEQFDFTLDNAPLPASELKKYAVENLSEEAVSPMRRTRTSDFYAGYGRPAGTYYGGFDKAGYMFYLLRPAIFGAWRQGVETWVWRNYARNASDVKWITIMGKNNGSQYTVGKWGASVDSTNFNLIDTFTVSRVGHPRYYSGLNRPLQIVSNGTLADTFLIGQSYMGGLDTVMTDGYTFAGSKNHFVDNGQGNFNPMTICAPQLITDTLSTNFALGFFNGTNSTAEWQPIYGTGKQTFFPVKSDGSYGDTLEVIPMSSFVQFHSKPQAPLYIHDITLPIFGWTKNDTATLITAPQIDTVQLAIFNSQNQIVAVSVATAKNVTRMGGRMTAMYMLQFDIQDVDNYGEVISEGITLNEAFTIGIYGLNNPNNKFGVISARDNVYGGSSYALYNNQFYWLPYDPEITLNAVFNALETDQEANLGDLEVNVRMRHQVGQGYDYYVAVYEDQTANYLPGLYSTFQPYDTVTGYFNYAVECPQWTVLDANMNYERQYAMNYYPFYIVDQSGVSQAGEKVVISLYGKSITFNIVTGAASGVNDRKATLSHVAYANNQFNLTYTNDFNAVEVYSVGGQKIGAYELPAGGSYSINANGLANGMYILRMKGNGLTETLRVVK